MIEGHATAITKVQLVAQTLLFQIQIDYKDIFLFPFH
jgi:hypothetical protein